MVPQGGGERQKGKRRLLPIESSLPYRLPSTAPPKLPRRCPPSQPSSRAAAALPPALPPPLVPRFARLRSPVWLRTSMLSASGPRFARRAPPGFASPPAAASAAPTARFATAFVAPRPTVTSRPGPALLADVRPPLSSWPAAIVGSRLRYAPPSPLVPRGTTHHPAQALTTTPPHRGAFLFELLP